MSGPLKGLRVLDIATIIAAPSAAALLADYGAEVTKLELPTGDGFRGFPPFKEGKPLSWKVVNRNKRFGTLDLRKPEGRALLMRLLPHFDVLVENFRPGTLDKWGMDRGTLWSAQPRLVILRVTGFGQTGPYKDRPGFARIFEAMGGLTYMTGEPDAEPMHAGYPIGDSIGGLFGALGILAALWKRAREPEAPGEEIDLSVTEAVLKLIDSLAIRFDQLGEIHERSGNRNQFGAPSAVYATADRRWVTLAGSTNALFANNCRAIGRPDLIHEERFLTNENRARHASELNEVFSKWCAAHSLDEVLTAFLTADGTIAPIYAVDQIFADSHFQSRGFLRNVPDDDFGTVRMQDVVPRFAIDPCHVESAAGALGRDNDAIYQSLGLSSEERQRLRQRGVI